MTKALAFMPKLIKENSNGYYGVRIEDELFDKREIFLTDDVNSESMEALFKQIMYLHRKDPNKEITIYINSPGGEVQSGLAVYDLMKLIKTPIKTVCIGTAASMGAILFLAGDKRVMMPNASIMIHDPSFASGDLQGMKPEEVEEKLKLLKQVQKIIVGIITNTTGNSEESVMKNTRKDTFFNPQKALKFGLATEIMEDL